MSVAKFGTNILVDGGAGRAGADYNAAIMRLLHQISVTGAGRAALDDVARQARPVRIVPPDTATNQTGGDVVVPYAPTPADQAGQMLLGALLNAGHDSRATGQATGRRMYMPIRITTPVGQASPIL